MKCVSTGQGQIGFFSSEERTNMLIFGLFVKSRTAWYFMAEVMLPK